MSWWPGSDTDIGIIFFLGAVFLFVVGLSKAMTKLFGESKGSTIVEYILMAIAFFGLLKGCGII